MRNARDQRWAKRALIAGAPADLVDQRHSLATHLPVALAFIVVSTVLILFLMTGSVVLPLIALVMNTLTVSVAFGVLVFIFQDGRFESTLGYMSQSALDTSMPILLFAVVFGLSTDYGVFLFQRIGEARRRTETEDAAIADGLVSSGRVITAAALLFAVAYGSVRLLRPDLRERGGSRSGGRRTRRRHDRQSVSLARHSWVARRDRLVVAEVAWP